MRAQGAQLNRSLGTLRQVALRMTSLTAMFGPPPEDRAVAGTAIDTPGEMNKLSAQLLRCDTRVSELRSPAQCCLHPPRSLGSLIDLFFWLLSGVRCTWDSTWNVHLN